MRKNVGLEGVNVELEKGPVAVKGVGCLAKGGRMLGRRDGMLNSKCGMLGLRLNVKTGLGMLECTINGVFIFCWHVVL